MSPRPPLPLVAISALSLGIWAPWAPAQPSSSAKPPTAPILFAKFEKSLSTRKAKVGDPITAKTIHDLRLKDLDIPKGALLLGAVSAVKSKKEGNGDSSLAIKFDRIEMKGNKEMRIRGLIVSIGQTSSPDGLGPVNVLSRGGVGTTAGVDPNLEIDKGAQDDIPPGSSLPGVALGKSLSPDGATELRGIKTDIKLDSDTEIKVALFKGM